MDLKTKLRRWYWAHRDSWWLSMIVRFLKGLFLLALWLAAAFGLFFPVYHYVLPRFIDKASLGKEPFTLLIPLVTALLGFAVQQWKGLEEEEQRRRREEEEALREVDEFSSLLKRDLSEGARRYLELKERPGRVWQSSRAQDALEKAWRGNAPPELQKAITVYKAWSETGEIRDRLAREALQWVYEHLDEDWRQRVARLLLEIDPDFTIAFVKQQWQALLAVWPEISLGQSIPSYLDADLIQGINYLELKRIPFDHEKAEHASRLLEACIYPAWWAQVSSDNWGIYITLPKAGRTATALLLTYEALKKQSAFPIYWRVSGANFDLQELTRVVARVIARYIAVQPRAFMNLPASRKKAVANLLGSCLGRDLTTYLHKVGLPRLGEGKRLAEELTTLVQDAPATALSQREWLALLGKTCPYDFPYLLILADVQGMAGEGTALNLYRLGGGLNRAGVILKAFVATEEPNSLKAYGRFISWKEEDLGELLHKCFEKGSLGDWCKLRAEGSLLEERLLRAAQGRPGELIRLGNELLRCIGRKQRHLTPEDFDAVLRA